MSVVKCVVLEIYVCHALEICSPLNNKPLTTQNRFKETFKFVKPIKCCCSQFIQINMMQRGTFKGNKMRLDVRGLSFDTLDIFCYDREVLLQRSLIAPHATVRVDFLGQGQDS